MGVPKFYRWISERYPCLSEVVKEHQIPEFDNLYLDMNGIIHPCSHPDDSNPHFRITEQQIFENIFHYIEVLFRMIRPQKVFFMAVDGVAPRAKMNQQRGRRFRSAREAEELEKRAVAKGELLPSDARFDSNCITPGTKFMCNLHEQLKYFVVEKISSDPTWQGIKIYLSGHEVPGEGEHKIMDFIRSEKTKPNYDSKTRHCLYGLDADLIMLGLTTHDPHFALLREEVKFGGKNSQKRITTVEETTFHLLHLSLMREYLDFEFSPLKDKLKFEYNLEHIIDDWVLMGFLVGNDFIPHLPQMHIHHDALPLLWKVYMEVMPQLDGYINEWGCLNLPRFEIFLNKLAQYDVEKFDDQFADLKWFEGKTGKKYSNAKKQGKWKKTPRKFDEMKFSVLDVEDEENGEEEVEANENTTLDNDDENEDDTFVDEFRLHKNNYYKEKLAYKKVTGAVLEEQARCYVTAIQWILHYYYSGCQSWSWYYPHHYAPYISDVRNFSHMKIEFDLSKPFLPYEQLMAVLPPASKILLPEPFQKLMTMDSSAIIEYYPITFESDLNGKQQDWEAVVLIPFIDEVKLLSAIRPVYDTLTPEDSERNKHSDCLLYEYTDTCADSYPSSMPGIFPDVVRNYSTCTVIPRDYFYVDPKEMKRSRSTVKDTQDIYFPGFPTLRNIPHRAELRKEGVKVFQMNSRGDNMIVQILPEKDEEEIENLAEEYLGHSLFVGWPHLYEARVISLSNDDVRYSVDEGPQTKAVTRKSSRVETKHEKMTQSDVSKWHRDVDTITEWYKGRRGVDVGVTFVLVYATALSGRKYVVSTSGNVSLEKQWSSHPEPFVIQATVKDLIVHDPDYKQYETMVELFPKDTNVFMLGSPHYGSMGQVLDVAEGRVRVNFHILEEPDLSTVQHQQERLSAHYVPGYIAAQRLGVSSHFMSRITGTMYVSTGTRENLNQKVNIALNLKFNKKNEEVPGYTKKTIEGQWLYSQKALDTVEEYMIKFPKLFEYIAGNLKEEMFFVDDIFPQNGASKLQALREYLKALPCAHIKSMVHGSDFLDEPVVDELRKQVETIKVIKTSNSKRRRSIKMQVRPRVLFRPTDNKGLQVPDPDTTYQLFDRVVNVRKGYSVPLGLRGTIIGITKGEKVDDKLYEVYFDEEFLSGLKLRCTEPRAYRLPGYAMINLTYADRKVSLGRKPTVGKSQGKATHQGQTQPVPSHPPHKAWTDRNVQSSPVKQSNNKGLSSPKFYTPKMDRGQKIAPRQIQQNKHQVNILSKPPSNGNSNEFSDIWNQLQAADPKVLQGPSLHDAAKALSNVTPPGVGAPPQLSPGVHTTTVTTGQKVDLETLFNQNKTTKPVTQEAKVTEEMSKMSLADQAQPSDTNLQEETEKLKSILQVGQDQRTEHKADQNNTEGYRKQISLHELFSASASPKDKITPTSDSQTHKISQDTPQGLPKMSKRVNDLLVWCYEKGMPPPHFEYQYDTQYGNKVVMAIVIFPNGWRFQSTWHRKKDEATDSAASVALLNLPRRFTRQPMTGQNQSAFRQVHPNISAPPGIVHPAMFNPPIRGQPHGVPIRGYPTLHGSPVTGHPPPYGPPVTGHPSPYGPPIRGHPPVGPPPAHYTTQHMMQVMLHTEHVPSQQLPPHSGTAPSKTSPFIPMQVTKKQTSKKENVQTGAPDNQDAKVPCAEPQPVSPVEVTARTNDNKSTDELKPDSKGSSSKTKTKQTPVTTGQSKSRSRLAANFGNN